MEQVKISEAKDRLEELVDRAASGETIVIERNGKPGARLVPEQIEAANETRFDADRVTRRLASQVMDPRSAEEIDAELRSLDRY